MSCFERFKKIPHGNTVLISLKATNKNLSQNAPK